MSVVNITEKTDGAPSNLTVILWLVVPRYNSPIGLPISQWYVSPEIFLVLYDLWPILLYVLSCLLSYYLVEFYVVSMWSHSN